MDLGCILASAVSHVWALLLLTLCSRESSASPLSQTQCQINSEQDCHIKWSKLPQITLARMFCQFRPFQAIKLAQGGPGQPTPEDQTTQGEVRELDELGEAKTSEDTGNTENEEETSVEFEDGCISTDEDVLIPTDSHNQESTITELKTPLRTYKLKWLLLKGSVLVLGVAMLVAGGVGSVFHPYVPPEEYSNCSDFIGDNDIYNHSIY